MRPKIYILQMSLELSGLSIGRASDPRGDLVMAVATGGKLPVGAVGSFQHHANWIEHQLQRQPSCRERRMGEITTHLLGVRRQGNVQWL